MELTIFYNVGNVMRKIAADMLMWELVKINPKFKVRVQAMPWPAYLSDLVAGNLPIFMVGLLADFADPHNFIFTFMHSKGTFTEAQSFKDPEIDRLVEAAVREVDPVKMVAHYRKLGEIYYREVISIPMAQPLGRRFERDWVKGMVL